MNLVQGALVVGGMWFAAMALWRIAFPLSQIAKSLGVRDDAS